MSEHRSEEQCPAPRHINRKGAEMNIDEAVEAFEAHAYPNASPETRRLLARARSPIRRFLDSELGGERKEDM